VSSGMRSPKRDFGASAKASSGEVSRRAAWPPHAVRVCRPVFWGTWRTTERPVASRYSSASSRRHPRRRRHTPMWARTSRMATSQRMCAWSCQPSVAWVWTISSPRTSARRSHPNWSRSSVAVSCTWSACSIFTRSCSPEEKSGGVTMCRMTTCMSGYGRVAGQRPSRRGIPLFRTRHINHRHHLSAAGGIL
jgi:hypothetical protein